MCTMTDTQQDQGQETFDEEISEEEQTEQQLQAELQDAVQSGRTILWVNFSLNIAGFILAVWVLLGMLGVLPTADTLLYVWVGVMALVFALQLHPDIKRVKRIRKDLDS
jgi:Flp pilus assembly protein TadB